MKLTTAVKGFIIVSDWSNSVISMIILRDVFGEMLLLLLLLPFYTLQLQDKTIEIKSISLTLSLYLFLSLSLSLCIPSLSLSLSLFLSIYFSASYIFRCGYLKTVFIVFFSLYQILFLLFFFRFFLTLSFFPSPVVVFAYFKKGKKVSSVVTWIEHIQIHKRTSCTCLTYLTEKLEGAKKTLKSFLFFFRATLHFFHFFLLAPFFVWQS